MEHVAEVIPRALNAHRGPSASAPSTTTTTAPTTMRALPDLAARLEEDERRDNPDLVTAVSSMRLTDKGLVEVRALGAFAMTEWSRSQLGATLGIRWNRWSENASADDQSDEINRRLRRATGTVRVRTRAFEAGGADTHAGAEGELRAFVSPSYSPVSDARLAGACQQI